MLNYFGGGVNRRLTIGAELTGGLYSGTSNHGFYTSVGPRFTLFPSDIYFVQLGAGAVGTVVQDEGDSSDFTPGLDLNAVTGFDFLFAKHFALVIGVEVGGRIFATVPNTMSISGVLAFRIY